MPERASSLSASAAAPVASGRVPSRAPRIVVVAPPELAGDVLAVLTARGLDATTAVTGADGGDALETQLADLGESLVAWAVAEPPDLATATRIAAAQRALPLPLLLQSPPLRKGARGSVDRAAAAAYLRSFGVAIIEDPDVWIEAIALVAYWGAPRGPRLALVAEPQSWLEAAALALPESGEARPQLVSAAVPSIEPADAVLVDARSAPPSTQLPALLVPVCPRGELATSPRWLLGLRPAVAAVTAVGRAVERAALGRGPAPLAASAELEIDQPRLERQLAKIGRFERRLGDHEAKVLLAAYGVPITRQAVATTPSAAVGLAKRIDAPVDIKPWGSDVPAERDGCPVEAHLETAAQIRRAFTTVLGGRGDGTEAASPGGEPAVIVRESPPAGRELCARIEKLPSVGLTVVVEAPGLPPAAAPAPLRLADATALSHHLIATRAGEPEPDRIALANLLRRASHLAADLEDKIIRLDMSRIVVGSRGDRTLVIDACAELRTS